MINRFCFSIVFVSLTATGCFGRNADDANAQDVEDTVGTARRLAVITEPATPYRVVSRSDTGSLSGDVLFDGLPQGDTTLLIEAAQNGCNKPLTIKRLERKNGKVANVVVWLTDIREGRSLPLSRRFELLNENCLWEPTVQVITAGGALNLFNEDPLVEQVSIVDIATGDTAGVAPFTDDGQVIPYGKIFEKPKVYEFSIESRPISRAWVMALDHPYSAITKSDGSFMINGIPAGSYTLRVWHPMLGMIDTTVQITARNTTTVSPRLP